MSIKIRLQELVGAGDLLFKPPTVLSSGSVRDVFVSNEVQAFLAMAPGIDPKYARNSGRAIAKIDAFASGKYVVFALQPFTKSPATLVARNHPASDGIVDLRVCGYHPDVRLFGAFAKTDILVLLTWAPKTNLHYATEVRKCRSVWNGLFPDFEPLVGETHADYISRNVIAG